MGKDGMKKDGMAKDAMSKDGMSKDGMSKGGMAKDGMSKDGMSKDGMSKDGMSKDGMSKGGMSKDGMSKDGMSSKQAGARAPSPTWSRTGPDAPRPGAGRSRDTSKEQAMTLGRRRFLGTARRRRWPPRWPPLGSRAAPGRRIVSLCAQRRAMARTAQPRGI